MITKVKKWGNELAILIPNVYAEEYGLSDGGYVSLKPNAESIIIEPQNLKKLNLRDLINKTRTGMSAESLVDD
ncbi:MAG: AbrB/MazE/SpoVT family DNA-binding domain-containing protein [bacterium]|nr:AbrB/MazE/SpoVT family DNA-binding domain-containing protein [bacterium]